MVHTFECCGKYLALDAESGSLHEVDKPAFEALSMNREKWEGVSEELIHKYGRSAMAETGEEISSLIRGGSLYTKAPQINLYPDAPVFKALCLHASHACNLRCTYCFAGQGHYGGEAAMMSAETGKKALDFLISNSGKRRHLEVDFFGGEPMMNLPAVREIVAYGRALENEYGKKISFTLTTNGIGLDGEAISFINREMDNVVVSIDGRKEIHDRLRKTLNGKGSFDLIIKGAKALSQSRKGKNHYIRGTFTRFNPDFAKDALYLADMGFPNISLEPVVALEKEPYSIRQKDLEKVFSEYEKLAEEYVCRRKEGKGFNFFHFMLDTEKSPCYTKRAKGCGAGYEYAAVSPEGDVYPCHQFVGEKCFRMGSVFEGKMDTGIIKAFRENNILTKPGCSACWAKYHCGGGCPANAYKFNHDIRKPYATGCEMQKKRLECAMYVLAAERE